MFLLLGVSLLVSDDPQRKGAVAWSDATPGLRVLGQSVTRVNASLNIKVPRHLGLVYGGWIVLVP